MLLLKKSTMLSEMSIGLPKEKSKESKTKDNVDLAGLSPPSLLVNPGMPSMTVHSEISLNNNSSIALDLMETTDVPEVSWITVSDTSETTESVPKTHIHTLLETDLAKSLLAPKALSPSLDIPMFLQDQPLDLNKLVTDNQFPLPVMLKTGPLIPVVFSPTVELPSITEFYLLDIPLLIG